MNGLDAKSMAATGVAASTIVGITNSLALLTNAVAPIYIALALSFLAGALSWKRENTIAKTLVLYIFASLSVFAAATGTNQLGANLPEKLGGSPSAVHAQTPPQQTPTTVIVLAQRQPPPPPTPTPRRFFNPWLKR